MTRQRIASRTETPCSAIIKKRRSDLPFVFYRPSSSINHHSIFLLCFSRYKRSSQSLSEKDSGPFINHAKKTILYDWNDSTRLS
ncbi:MAG: hypothetical protein FJ267_08630 [Planctomycetes bacterium]|nr:hypothetical protein [Planctomycetota bacterium]